MEIKIDPVENTEAYLRIRDELEAELAAYREIPEKEANDFYEEFGIMPSICHRLWDMKKKILRDNYGIEWKTPAEMNPEVNFD